MIIETGTLTRTESVLFDAHVSTIGCHRLKVTQLVWITIGETVQPTNIDPMMNRNYLRMMNSFFKNVMRRMKKDEGLTILSTGLLKSAHSLARSHYCPTRKLLAARFPFWPGSLLLRQPGPAGFLRLDHVDAGLSADTCSTQATIQQDSRPQASHSTKPLSSRITGMRHIPGGKSLFSV